MEWTGAIQHIHGARLRQARAAAIVEVRQRRGDVFRGGGLQSYCLSTIHTRDTVKLCNKKDIYIFYFSALEATLNQIAFTDVQKSLSREVINSPSAIVNRDRFTFLFFIIRFALALRSAL